VCGMRGGVEATAGHVPGLHGQIEDSEARESEMTDEDTTPPVCICKHGKEHHYFGDSTLTTPCMVHNCYCNLYVRKAVRGAIT